MGLLTRFSRWTKRLLNTDDELNVSASESVRRRCRFETFESRRMLSADPLYVGSVYIEEDLGSDLHGDTFELTFAGGAPGTTLDRVTINGDQTPGNNNLVPIPLAAGDVFFDTANGGLGADHAFPFTVVSNSGVGSVQAFVVDGTTTLVLQFTGFEAGDKLVFSIDVDEVEKINNVDPNQGFDPVTSGLEFEGSSLTAEFSAAHYHDISGTSTFFNFYDPNFAGKNLNLPADDFQGKRDRSAGAVVDLQQQPLPVTIAGNVWHDRNFDLQHDPGEEGIAGVTLQLWKKDENTGTYQFTQFTETTDAQGNYKFGEHYNLQPGTYRVVEGPAAGFAYDVGAVPGTVAGAATGATYAADPKNVLTEITIPLGDQHAVNYDFAEAKPAGISGYVYHDRNDNALRETGEEGIGGVRVQLVPLSTIVPQSSLTVTTNAAGYYEFKNLAPGSYRVVELDQPVDYIDGKDAAGTINGVTVGAAVNPGDEILAITLNSENQGVEYNFGEIKLAELHGYVSITTPDGDCRGPGDPQYRPLQGVTITLVDEHGVTQTTTTAADGTFSFVGLTPGTYKVIEGPTPGYLDGGDHVGTVKGVHVGANSSNDVISAVRLEPGDVGVEYAFCEHEPSSISGYVYHDVNDSGVFDAGDSPLGGQTVMLLDSGGAVIASQTTDGQGFYNFDGLAKGVYSVMEVQPAGYLDSADSVGTINGVTVGTAGLVNDKIQQIALKYGEDGVNYNFGEVLPGCISGYVYHDANESGVYDAGDNPLAGQTVMLINSTGATVGTLTTDANGYYEFCDLLPGTYTVMEVQPAAYLDGADNVGTVNGVTVGTAGLVNDKIVNVTVGHGQKGVNYNFGELLPASISGYVFQDGAAIFSADGSPPADVSTIRDGRRTPDDTPLAGVVLELRDGVTGLPIDASTALPGFYGPGPIRTVTDANGFYQFLGLPPGNYAVFEVQPAGYFDAIDTPGTLGGVAVNPHAPPSAAVLTPLSANPNNDAILRIQVGQGQHAAENNFSEIATFRPVPPPEFPPPPPQFIPPQPIPILQPLNPATPFTPPPASFDFDGVGGFVPYTWHLSIVNAGNPRGEAVEAVADSRDNVFRFASQIDQRESRWTAEQLEGGLFELSTGRDGDSPAAVHRFVFGLPGATPVSGDFNGDGIDEIGVFLDGEWFLDLNGNGKWDENDLWAKLGNAADQPVTGDWDFDGKDDIGIFGPIWPGDPRAIRHEPGLPDADNAPKNKPKNVPPEPEEATDGKRALQRGDTGRPREDLIDHVFYYGRGFDVAVSGDWNGDGIRSVGVFRFGTWHLDMDGDGKFTRADKVLHYGDRGDLPIVGDFNGDGVEEIGVYRAGEWHIDIDGNHEMDAHDRVFEMGGAADIPVVGDFDGDGIDDPGLYREIAAPPTDRQARLE